MNRRYRLVEAVLAAVAATGEAEVPPALRAEVDAEFGGFAGLLREVQVKWYRAFDARLDAVLEERPAVRADEPAVRADEAAMRADGFQDMRAALVGLWLDLGDAMPAARFLLDTHIDHPALTALHDRHRRSILAATGVLLDPQRYHQPPPPVSRPCRVRRLIGLRPEGAR